jgi:hypothetical protein
LQPLNTAVPHDTVVATATPTPPLCPTAVQEPPSMRPGWPVTCINGTPSTQHAHPHVNQEQTLVVHMWPLLTSRHSQTWYWK